MMLRTYDIRYLIFTGVTANICVESSLREACHLEYLSVLVSDATAAQLLSQHESAIANVKQIFGWVTTSGHIINALKK